MPHFAARSVLGAIALLGLASMKPVVDCHGCNASSLGTTYTGLEGGWDLSISIGVTNGRCHPLDGNPAECVAEACLSTILVSGTGPAHGSFTVCYEQTGAPPILRHTGPERRFEREREPDAHEANRVWEPNDL